MLFFVLFLLFFIYIALKFHEKKQRFDYLVKNFNGPPRHPFYGTLKHFPKNAPGIFKVNQYFLKRYGKNFVVTRPIMTASIIVSDPVDVETILSNPNTKNAKKADFYRFFEVWLGTGLLTAFGEKWFSRRKIITPSFHFSILEGFVDVMSHQSDILVKKLRSHIGEKDIEIYEPVNLFALDVICETSMGVSINAQNSPNSEYVKAVKQMTLALQRRAFSPLARIWALYAFTENGKKIRQLLKVLHGFTTKVITERRTQLLNNTATKTGRMNFMDILLHATINGKPLTNEDIREEVDTFMFEGHDTTASGIAFTLYLLSKHEEVQEKVYQELVEVFGSDPNNVEITSKKLNELVYLDMVIKESLRILPPVSGIGRHLLEETVIGGIKVPAGTNVSISIYGMHHDADNFPDPEKFDPERFSPHNSKKPGFSYVPFSAGGRNCIGKKFALLDLKDSVAKVLLNFHLLPSDKELILQSDLILKSSNGIYINLEERIKK